MQTSNRDRGRSEDGFTLAEVLVSLAILALIVSLCAAAISFTTRAAMRAGTSDHDRRIAAVRDVVSLAIEGAMPLTVALTDDAAGLGFVGEQNRILFIGQSVVPTEAPGLYAIEFAQGEADTQLVLRYWRHHTLRPLLERPDHARERALVSDLERLEFSYGRFDAEQGWIWAPQWRSRTGSLPDAVTVNMVGGASENLFRTSWFIPIALRRSERDAG